MQSKSEALSKLRRSGFRSGFHLSQKEKDYILEKGMPTIRRHAAELIEKRLAPAVIPNDGKQTPMHGHPVFIAQHACACCCRGCLFKWYNVPQGVALTETQKEKIIGLLMAWLEEEMTPRRQPFTLPQRKSMIGHKYGTV